MHRTSYKIEKKDLSTVLNDALGVCRKSWVDELDCSKSLRRTKSDMWPRSSIDLIETHTVVPVFIHRDMSFLPQEYLEDGKNPNRNYWDVGFYTLGYKPEYFLWIELEEDDGWNLVKKYNLQLH